MRLVIIAIITVVVATGLGLLSNNLANKIQPHLENRTCLLIILFSVFFGMAVVLAVASTYKAPVTDALKITSIKTVEDSQTQISTIGDQGVISAYWEVMLSNVGESSLSVTSYDVKQVGEDFPAVFYSGMNQGLYVFEDGNFKPLDLPIEITPGNTRKVFVRIGLLITPEAFKLIKENFSDSSNATLKTIWHFLFTKGTDFYGNKVEPLPAATGFRLPAMDQVREQVFGITFKTSRGASIVDLVSWYKYGGAYDPRRH
jgi:hypothetical protein